MKKALRIIGRILKWILLILAAFFLLIFIIWKVPAVHNYALKEGTGYFNDKTKGNLSVDEIDLRLPFYIGIRGISLADPDSQKIASIGEIEIYPGWRALLNNTIKVDDVEISELDAEVFRNASGKWNYDFIIETFASESAPKESESEWDFAIGNVKLREIKAKYYDIPAGDSLSVDVESLDLEMQEFSVLENVYALENLVLAQNDVYYRMGSTGESNSEKDEAENTSGETKLPVVDLKFLDVSETKFQLDLGSVDPYRFDIGHLALKTEKIDLEKEIFHLKNILIENSSVAMALPPAESSDSNQTSEPSSIFLSQSIRLGTLNIDNFDFEAHSADSQDDINLKNTAIKAKNIRADSSGYYASVQNIGGVYNQFDQLRDFHTELALTPEDARVEKLQLTYGSSEIKIQGSAQYASFENLLEGTVYNAELEVDLISVFPSDLNRIKNNLSIPDSVMPKLASPLLFSGRMKGNVESFSVDDILLKTGNTRTRINLSSKGDSLWPRDIALKNFNVEAYEEDIFPYVEFLGIDSSMVPPRTSLKVSGDYRKTDMNLKGDLKTTFGNIDLAATGSGWKNKDDLIEIDVSSDSLQISDYLKSGSPLSTDLKLQARIQNIQSDTVSACLAIDVDELLANDYTYNGIRLDAGLDGTEANYALLVNDDNVKTQIGGALDFNKGIIASAEGEIEGIDLENLKFTSDDIRGSLKFAVHFEQDSISTSGNLAIDEILILNLEERYDFQPVKAEFYDSSDSSFLQLNSQFADIKSVSNRGFSALGNGLAEYYTAGKRPVDDSTSYWTLDLKTGTLEDARAIFLQDLKEFEPATASINYKASDKKIASDIVFPLINYSGIKIDSLEFHSAGDEERLSTGLFIKETSYDSLSVDAIDLTLSRIEKGARFELSMNGQDRDNSYYLGANMLTDSLGIGGGFQIDVKDSIVLNGNIWDYRDDGRFAYTSKGIQIDSLEISRNGSSLSFHKESDASSLTLNARKFNIEALTRIVNTEAAVISGILSGALTLNADGSFIGDGEIAELAVYEAQFGRLTWSAEKENERYRARISNQGELAKFNLNGTLTPVGKTDSELDLTFNLDEFNLQLLSTIAPAILAESSGNLMGEIKITGTTSEPIVEGRTTMQNSRLRLNGSNITYEIGDESIDIERDKFSLNKFTIRDGAGQKLEIDGVINHKNFSKFNADMTLKADEFELLNVKKSAGESIYGKLIASLDIGIRGEISSPEIKANIGISPKTEMTYVVSFESSAVAFEEDLLVWTDFDESEEDSRILTREKEESAEPLSIFANTPTLDGKLNIDKNATFNVIIDSVAGDYLTVKGGGNLGINYDNTGNLRLSGNYEVTSGYYQMTFYNLVKKRFDFQKGSRLVWNGEPTNASLNITALYKTRTGIANLMLAEPGASYNEAFQQQLPFEVVMDIKGEILKPEIYFNIRLEESKKDALGGSVASRLKALEQNESEMNKQVFALLILNSFIPSGSNSGNTNVVANQARNSASQILTQQLNNLSDKYVEGININMDVSSYGGAAGDGNTDLNVNVAKSFFNDRVTLRVGSSIALESSDATQSSQQMMTNVEAEYKLTEDGRYRLKAFSKTDLEDIVVGRITRTGGGFIFQRDFNRFRNLFKPEEDDSKAEEEKEEKESEGSQEEEKSKNKNEPKPESD
ncbi:MAG: translocation/assembly module TamB domain-containing protein [Cryomorphaceae bacterium]